MHGEDSQQTELLRNIWNEMKAVKASLEKQLEATREEIGQRIDQTNERLDQTNESLDALRRRVTESEMRLATATTELANDVHELSGLVRDWRWEHRSDRAELRTRVTLIEEHVGLRSGGP